MAEYRQPSPSRIESWMRLLIFVVAWGVLDTLFNLRYPGGEPAFWYVLPSIDVVVLLAAFMLVRTRGYRVADGLRFALVGLLLAVRIFRCAEGLVERHFHRPLNLYVDVALLPNLAGLLRSTVSWPRLCVWAVLIAVGLVALGALCWWALAATERALSWPGPRRLFVAGLVACLLLSPFWSRRRHPELHVGLFGTSIVPRLAREVSFLRHAPDYRRESLAGITHMRERLGTIPTGLELLHDADVQLILIESYGETVLERADFTRRMEPVYRAFESELGARGFAMASSLLSSTTYGGRSWLAHAALATGVRTDDGLAYAVLLEAQPPPLTMAGFFRAAGYRTVLVQPGTTTRWPEGEVVGFDKKYYLMDLDYQGPTFKWATMPDQYVLDFIHRREVERRPGTTRAPLFVEYALVSSHSPWSLQPRIVADWDQLREGGRIFNQMEPVRFPITWSNLEQGGDAYITSVIYDMDVLRRYIAERVDGDALLILLGDHQPSAEVTYDSPSFGVPIHVISRDRALVQRFITAGYVRGMRAVETGEAPPPMEGFMPQFLEMFSNRR